MTTLRTQPALVPFLDACAGMGVSKAAGYRALREGTFPIEVVKVGGMWKVRKTDLDRILYGDER